MNIPILVLLLTMSVNSLACECPEYELQELDKVSYERSSVVLIGNISHTGIKYQIEIIEILKGKINSKKITGLTISDNEMFNSCIFHPGKKGEYLLYLKVEEIDGKIYYYSSACSGSRLLNFEYQPVSLDTEKTKAELIEETIQWTDKLKNKKDHN